MKELPHDDDAHEVRTTQKLVHIVYNMRLQWNSLSYVTRLHDPFCENEEQELQLETLTVLGQGL